MRRSKMERIPRVPRRISVWSRMAAALLLTGAGAAPSRAEVPRLLNYQGRIAVAGVAYSGDGKFKFALVNADGTRTHWSNDGTSAGGQAPTASVTLSVSKGLYQVLLGDTSLTNMTVVPHAVFAEPDVRLRIWFDDGLRGFQKLSPDQRLAPAGYAMKSASADRVELSGILAEPARQVVAWGVNTDGALNVPAGLSGVTQVAAGDGFSLALKSDGTVAAWGKSTSGQTVVPASASTGVTGIAAGTAHCLAIRADGTVAAWGANDSGQTSVPAGLSGVVRVAAGQRHSMALRTNGTVVVWGGSAFGQTAVPAGLTGVTSIACGWDHCLALTGAGGVTAWGRNDVGQCTVPAGLTSVRAVAGGGFHSLALKNDGTVAAWGWNTGGQSTVPAGLTNVTAIEAGYAHSVAAKTDGSVVAWGNNSAGETTVPARLGGVTALSAFGIHTLALRSPLVPAALARLDAVNLFTEKTGLGRTPLVNMLEVEGQASKLTAGAWVANSDRRIKTEIQAVTGALETLDRVRPVTFRYTPEYLARHPGIPDVPYYNVIAQEFREVFPDAVKSSGDLLPDGGGEILQVDTHPAAITSLAAIQELHALVKARDREIADLQTRLARLEAAAETRAAEERAIAK